MSTPLTDTHDGQMAAGRAALEAADWRAALSHFAAAAQTDAAGEALDGLAWAHWWLDEAGETIDARGRAYRAHCDAGDEESAGATATWLASDYFDFRGDVAVGGGWLRRAHRLLDGRPPCPAQGWLALIEGEQAMGSLADPLAAERLASQAISLGRGLGVSDLEVLGLARKGAALVIQGRIDDGIALLDEATALACQERFDLALTATWTLCITVGACERLGDLPRAGRWCAEMQALAARWRGRHMAGMCRSSYGSVLATGGDWDRADAELTAAVADLRVTRPALAPAGCVRLGELRRRQGRPEEARVLFEESLPHDGAVLGLGRLVLDEGDHASAADAADRVLRRLDVQAHVDRVPALELLARARCAGGDGDGADRAAQALDDAVGGLATPYLAARALLVRGELAAAHGDLEGARRAFEDAVDGFARAHAPYEGARARTALARALRELGRRRPRAARPPPRSRPSKASARRWTWLPRRPCWRRRPPARPSCRSARRRCCGSSPRGSAMPRSRAGWCSARTPSTATWPTSASSCASPRGRRRSPTPRASGCCSRFRPSRKMAGPGEVAARTRP